MGRKIQEHYLRSLEADNDRLLEENRRLREALEEIYTRDCALAVSHEMECHRKDYAREVLGGGSD